MEIAIIIGILFMVIILCVSLILSNRGFSIPLSDKYTPMTDEQEFAKDCKEQTGLDLFDMTYVKEGGYEQVNMNGDVSEKCIQLSYHDKYGRLRKIESRTFKYDKNGEYVSQSAWTEEIPEYPLRMYEFKNIYRNYKEWKDSKKNQPKEV